MCSSLCCVVLWVVIVLVARCVKECGGQLHAQREAAMGSKLSSARLLITAIKSIKIYSQKCSKFTSLFATKVAVRCVVQDATLILSAKNHTITLAQTSKEASKQKKMDPLVYQKPKDGCCRRACRCLYNCFRSVPWASAVAVLVAAVRLLCVCVCVMCHLYGFVLRATLSGVHPHHHSCCGCVCVVG